MARQAQSLTNVVSTGTAIVSMDMLKDRCKAVLDSAQSFRNSFSMLVIDSTNYFLGDGNKNVDILNEVIQTAAESAKTLNQDPEMAARRMAGYFVKQLGLPHRVIYKKTTFKGKARDIPYLGKRIPKSEYPDIKKETLEASVKQFDLKPVKAKPAQTAKVKELSDIEKQAKSREFLQSESKKIQKKMEELKLDPDSSAYRLMIELKAACDQAVTELQDSDSE